MLVKGVVAGLVLLGLVFEFIVRLRAQTLAAKQNGALMRGLELIMDVHKDVLDNLAVAANPDAWLAQQAEKARKERREEEKELEASDKTPDPEGVF